MYKNHFYFAYAGNKRQEFIKIYETLKPLLESGKIKTIIEPYCGSSSISYFISVHHPKQFKYILNDNSTNLYNLYNASKDIKKIEALETKINDIAMKVENDKQFYNNICKNDNLLENWVVKNKIYNIRPGLFRTDYKYKEIKLKDYPIYKFINSENIEFYNLEGLEIINKYKNNSDCLIILDPPYLLSCNDYYDKSRTDSDNNIYEYIFNNDIKKYEAPIILILNLNWITRLLFRDFNIIEYNKKYEVSKKNISHGIIINKPNF
jgi:hypothetical protein